MPMMPNGDPQDLRLASWALLVMIIGDPEGQLYLSHPHTSNVILFRASHQIPHLCFLNSKKLPIMLRCDIA